jgi:hypothetical protein
MIALVIGLFTVLISLLLCLSKKTRALGVHALAYALAVTISVHMGVAFDRTIRLHEFEQLGERSAPLIAALEAFVDDKGVPPPSLVALVPEYLEQVPSTGMAAYPDYALLVDNDHTGNAWALRVGATASPFDLHWFEKFVYLPNGAYDRYEAHGVYKPLGEWAYFYEDAGTPQNAEWVPVESALAVSDLAYPLASPGGEPPLPGVESLQAMGRFALMKAIDDRSLTASTNLFAIEIAQHRYHEQHGVYLLFEEGGDAQWEALGISLPAQRFHTYSARLDQNDLLLEARGNLDQDPFIDVWRGGPANGGGAAQLTSDVYDAVMYPEVESGTAR